MFVARVAFVTVAVVMIVAAAVLLAQLGHRGLDLLGELLFAGGVFKRERNGHGVAAFQGLLEFHQHDVIAAGLEFDGLALGNGQAVFQLRL